MSVQPTKILGIDPGFARCGYGIIETSNDSLTYIHHGVIETPAGMADEKRLLSVANEIAKLITTHSPNVVSIEELFFFKNAKTAMKVAQARGVILATIARHKIPITSFTPLQIKQALTGYGRADKNQIQEMVMAALRLGEIPKPDDAADGLACAICDARMSQY